MSEERMRILEMVRDGKITAEDGVRLLEAVQPKTEPRAPGVEQDDPLGSLASSVAQALQSGDWRGMLGQFAGSWSSGPMHGAEKRREREAEGWEFISLSEGDHGTFELPEGSQLMVEHESGSIEATAEHGPARLELESEAAHDFAIYVARKDKDVVVVCHRTAPFARMPRLRLHVPQHVAGVSLKTAGGSVTAAEFSVPVRLKTAGGSVRVRDQRGADVHARTAGGGIKVDGTPYSIDLHTSGGSINFAGQTEAFDVKTSGGSITLDGVHLMDGEHIAKTSGGSIRIGVTPESRLDIDAKTSAGGLHVDLPGAEGERTGGKVSPRYHGRFNGGGARLIASTAAGTVTIGLSERGGAARTANAQGTPDSQTGDGESIAAGEAQAGDTAEAA